MHKILLEFREFAERGNVMDLAVGLVLGTAFKEITNSLVKDIITPVIGALTGGVNFDHLFLSLSVTQYATLEQAQEAGVATLGYGKFITQVIEFVIIAFAMFMVVRTMNRLAREVEQR
ncbi:MAG: large conductance mechanosensitive channel protein MscL, partial [Anaerolineaceae bacterium]|nr:large conductance mechanosensitive channel protein MscL [Anaerolineaceae bacterium]